MKKILSILSLALVISQQASADVSLNCKLVKFAQTSQGKAAYLSCDQKFGPWAILALSGETTDLNGLVALFNGENPGTPAGVQIQWMQSPYGSGFHANHIRVGSKNFTPEGGYFVKWSEADIWLGTSN